MDFSGERRIAAPRETVWAALNDPAILKSCIPGCESVEKTADTAFKFAAAVTIGPIAARFTGNLLLSDLDPPNGYTISADSQGGVAGSATAIINIALEEASGETRLTYNIDGKAEGRVAQLSPDLKGSTAQQYIETFFTKLAAEIAPPTTASQGPAMQVYNLPHEDHDHDPSNPHFFGLPLGVIIAGIAAVISVGITMAKFLL